MPAGRQPTGAPSCAVRWVLSRCRVRASSSIRCMHQRRRLATCQLPDMNDELDVPLCAACHPTPIFWCPSPPPAPPRRAIAAQAMWAAEWAAEDARIQEEVSTGLVRRRGRRRGVGSGRRRRRRRNGQRQQAAQRMREQIQQEVRERLDQVRWEERQAEQWQVVEWGWWLVQRRAVRVGSSRRSAAGRGTVFWVAAASGAAALERRVRVGERGGSAASASLCRQRVRAAGAGRGHGPRYRRLGGGGKRGWVT